MSKIFMEVSLRCPFCGEFHSVSVDLNDFADWQMGKHAQDAFPYLSPTEREQLISEMCPKCQKKIFGGDDFQPVYDDPFIEIGDEDFLKLIGDL